jgi:hypothetical protein
MKTHFLLCILLFAAGCGGPPYRVQPVSGTVTLDGRPLADARVSFEPRREGEAFVAGPGSYGKTDGAGRYQLRTLEGQRGAVVATHDVTISTYQGKADPASDEPTVITPEKVPARYFELGSLTFTVPAAGSDTADFQLVSDERWKRRSAIGSTISQHERFVGIGVASGSISPPPIAVTRRKPASQFAISRKPKGTGHSLLMQLATRLAKSSAHCVWGPNPPLAGQSNICLASSIWARR